MKAIDGDIRRYAWTHGQAFWRMAMPVPALLEDARGAADAGQIGLLRHTARNLGTACAVTLAFVEFDARPAPSPRAQAGWALDQIQGHPLADDIETLIRGDASLTGNELLAKCNALSDQIDAIVGKTPHPMSPEGYFPSMGLLREWLKLAQAVGEVGFLPREWTGAL
jgi:hypothetical protein